MRVTFCWTCAINHTLNGEFNQLKCTETENDSFASDRFGK